jgi:hypothetical protein
MIERPIRIADEQLGKVGAAAHGFGVTVTTEVERIHGTIPERQHLTPIICAAEELVQQE